MVVFREMAVVVHGFPTNTQALQFEYVWQRAHRSRFTKTAVNQVLKKGTRGFGRSGAVARKLAHLMLILCSSPWSQLPLTVLFTKPEYHDLAATLMLSTVCTRMPVQIRTHINALDSLKETLVLVPANTTDSTICIVCAGTIDPHGALKAFQCNRMCGNYNLLMESCWLAS